MARPAELSDPRPIAQGFGSRAVLLLHGLTGTPAEVRPLAESLTSHGFAVRGPLLAGHGDLASLEASSWRQWYASAEEAFLQLREQGKRRVVVLGFSAGGLLALRLAALRPQEIEGLVLVSVPLQLPAWQRMGIATLARLRQRAWLRPWVGQYPKRRGPDVRILRESMSSPSLPAFPFPALAELTALQQEVAELLPYVRAPLLLLHGKLDHTAPVEHSEIITQRVASAQVRRVILPRSFHLVGLDLDREQAAQEILGFVGSVLGDPRPADRRGPPEIEP